MTTPRLVATAPLAVLVACGGQTEPTAPATGGEETQSAPREEAPRADPASDPASEPAPSGEPAEPFTSTYRFRGHFNQHILGMSGSPEGAMGHRDSSEVRLTIAESGRVQLTEEGERSEYSWDGGGGERNGQRWSIQWTGTAHQRDETLTLRLRVAQVTCERTEEGITGMETRTACPTLDTLALRCEPYTEAIEGVAEPPWQCSTEEPHNHIGTKLPWVLSESGCLTASRGGRRGRGRLRVRRCEP